MQNKKIALITGITGQDGSYLAEQLLQKDYIVHGIIRRTSSFNDYRIKHLSLDLNFKDRFFLHCGDLTDSSNINNLIESIKPDEIYNLAAQSHVKASFDIPEYTADTDAIGVLRILEAIRKCGLINKTRFYQASTSELFGKVQETPQTEKTPFYPRSPYAVAKLYAFWIVVNYRESYGIHASNGILYNHESERRSEAFVTRKITNTVAKIKKGHEKCLILGNLDARRDWGYAPEYTDMMWRILQQDKPDDYVCATHETHTVRDFCLQSFKFAGIDIEFYESGVNEIGVDRKTGETLIKVSPDYFRPAEVDLLIGNAEKAEKILDWKPKVKFNELVQIMTEFDLNLIK